jgi:hypothetical protein
LEWKGAWYEGIWERREDSAVLVSLRTIEE